MFDHRGACCRIDRPIHAAFFDAPPPSYDDSTMDSHGSRDNEPCSGPGRRSGGQGREGAQSKSLRTTPVGLGLARPPLTWDEQRLSPCQRVGGVVQEKSTKQEASSLLLCMYVRGEGWVMTDPLHYLHIVKSVIERHKGAHVEPWFGSGCVCAVLT